LEILSRIWGVTIDGVWISEWIYWPPVYTIRNYTLQFTDTQTSVLNLLQSPLAVSWQWLLPREILKLPVLRFSYYSSPCRTLCQLTNQLTGSQLAAISHQPPSLLFTEKISADLTTELSHSPTSYFTSLNWTADNSTNFSSAGVLVILRGGPNRKHGLQQSFYYCHGSYLAIDWISFPRERVYRQLLRVFVYSPIA
jgi:hypothetical protein